MRGVLGVRGVRGVRGESTTLPASRPSSSRLPIRGIL